MLFSIFLIVFIALCAALSVVLFPAYWIIELIARLYPDVVWKGTNKVNSSNSRRIFLTIDDAPSGDRTLQILALLDRYSAKATFFCIGSHMQNYPKETKEILLNGHSIANHTMYDRKSINLSTDLLEKEIIETESLIEMAYSNCNAPGRLQTHRFFRPGHGFFNKSLLSIIHKVCFNTLILKPREIKSHSFFTSRNLT